MLVVAMISLDAHSSFSNVTGLLEDVGIVVFWLHCATSE